MLSNCVNLQLLTVSWFLRSRGDAVADAKRLRMGRDAPAPTSAEAKKRIAMLRATVTKYLPNFARGVAEVAAQGGGDV